MRRILAGNTPFYQRAPRSLYEHSFEAIVRRNSSHLFPGYGLVPFRERVSSEHGGAEADLALIADGVDGWWVVEVELATHSFAGHVLPQVAALSNGTYGREHAEALCAAGYSGSQEALLELVQRQPPTVLVVVNQVDLDWERRLARWGAVVMGVEVYESRGNHISLLVDRAIPDHREDLVSRCYEDPTMPSLLRVEHPARLLIPSGGMLEAASPYGLTLWRRTDSGTATWLAPTRRYPLPESVKTVELRRNPDGSYYIKPLTRVESTRRDG